MKYIVLFTTFFSLLFVAPEGFAQSYTDGAKHKHTTIIYEDGSKYVGEIVIYNLGSRKKKLRDGVMYYANGDVFAGKWDNDLPSYGTYRYANGNCFKGSFKKLPNDQLILAKNKKGIDKFWPANGQLTLANKGSIKLGDKLWEYPANSSFHGEIKSGNPYTGSFDCALTNIAGDKFTGKIESGKLYSGVLLFANGDIFRGSFDYSVPDSGKYHYFNSTETHNWFIPAGCVFEGNVKTFTGTVNMEITNGNGDRFIGTLKDMQPYEGTMTFANGTTETGKWHDGMSPSAYKTYLAEKARKDIEAFEKEAQQTAYGTVSYKNDLWPGAVLKLSQLFIGKKVSYKSQIYTCKDIRKTESRIEMLCTGNNGQNDTLRFFKIGYTSDPSMIVKIATNSPRNIGRIFYYAGDYDNNKCCLLSDQQNIPAYVKNYYIRKFGTTYGLAVMNKRVELGMTLEMVQAIHGGGNVRRNVNSQGQEYVELSYEFGSRYYIFVNNRLDRFRD